MVGDQDVQDLVPGRSLPARGQAFGPEPVELQVSPQQAGQPTGAPLTGTMQAKFGQAQPHHRRVVRLATILGEQGQRPGAPASASNTSTALRQACVCDELISPKYRTYGCTTWPSSRRLFSTILQ